MKRTLALLTAAMIALTALSATAFALENTPEYTLEEKFERQVLAGSGIKGEIAFTASGDTLGTLDAASFAAIRSMLPMVRVPVSYIAPRGEQYGLTSFEAGLAYAGGAELSLLALIGREDVFTLSGALLGEQSLAAEKDSGTLLRALTGNESVWPGLAAALGRLLTAEDDYKTLLERALSPYTTKLSLFMQGYTKTALVKDAATGQSVTTTTVRIPAPAFIAQTKQLLIDLYSDSTLIALLTEKLTTREAAAYLQKSMLPTFYMTLDALALEGEVAIDRRYDTTGTMISQEISLPFAAGQAFSSLTVTQTPEENNAESYRIKGELKKQSADAQKGSTFDVTLIVDSSQPDETLCSGTLSFLAEEAPADDNFQVGKQETAQPFTMGYSLYIQNGGETYDAYNDIAARSGEITLVCKPTGGDIWNAISLSLTYSLSSKSSKRAVINLESMLNLQDLQSGASIKATLNARTAAPWTVTPPEQANPVRVDLLDADAFRTLLNSTLQTLRQNVSALPAMLLDQNAGEPQG